MGHIKNQHYVKELSDLIEDEIMTGFQLKDILNEESEYQLIKRRLTDQLRINEKIRNGNMADYLNEIECENEEREIK